MENPPKHREKGASPGRGASARAARPGKARQRRRGPEGSQDKKLRDVRYRGGGSGPGKTVVASIHSQQDGVSSRARMATTARTGTATSASVAWPSEGAAPSQRYSLQQHAPPLAFIRPGESGPGAGQQQVWLLLPI